MYNKAKKRVAMPMSVPPTGHESSYPLMLDTGYVLTVRHGSSPRLVSQVRDVLAEEFQPFDPLEDDLKWSRRGLTLYYVAVEDPAIGEILCALRAATEGIIMVANTNNNSPPGSTRKRKSDGAQLHQLHQQLQLQRILIDYMYTIPEARGEGIAGLLVPKVLELAQGAPCYVVSIDESRAYWRQQHQFGKCRSHGLNQLMNLFHDTTLMTLRRRQRQNQQSSSSLFWQQQQQQQQQQEEEDGNNKEEEEVVEEDALRRTRLKRIRLR
jgi:GNAT superfamily N-acetyltransferase